MYPSLEKYDEKMIIFTARKVASEKGKEIDGFMENLLDKAHGSKRREEYEEALVLSYANCLKSIIRSTKESLALNKPKKSVGQRISKLLHRIETDDPQVVEIGAVPMEKEKLLSQVRFTSLFAYFFKHQRSRRGSLFYKETTLGKLIEAMISGGILTYSDISLHTVLTPDCVTMIKKHVFGITPS